MNPLHSFAPLAQAFGFTVAHSLWQIALIWLIFKLLEWRLSHRHQAMYLLSMAAMLVSAIWAGVTFAAEWARFKPLNMPFSPIEHGETFEPSAVVPTGATTVFSLWDSTQIWLENHAAQIGWAWLGCAALLWLRLIGGWWLAQRLRSRGISPVAETLQSRCAHWAKRLKINSKVQLLESPYITEPLTLGFWKPVVLFPVGMLLQLSTAQVEALLLHELAHIRRHDYLLNLFQLALEVCFFYHPLFWLLSREARSRREFCCDELVLRHTSDPILYAKTLTDLQISSLHPSTQFVMNATGKNRFAERILYIVGISPKRSTRPNWFLALSLPVIVALCSWDSISPKLLDKEALTPTETITTDSLPPQKAASPSQKVARPHEIAKPKPTTDPVLSDLPVPADKKEALPSANHDGIAMEVVKMNVFYVGVDNPLRIAAAGIPTSELRVKLLGNGTIDGGDGNYIVRVTQTGGVTVRVMRQVGDELKFVADQKYRVKPIPDPRPKLDGVYGSDKVEADLMLQTKGIRPMLENFDFDVICEIVGFEVTYLPMAEDPTSRNNTGGTWNPGVLEMIKKAKSGDTYFFDDIKVKCAGDIEPRNLGGLAYKIK